MRVVLINPPVISVSEPWFDEPDFVRTALAFLAAYLRKYSLHEVYCVDAKFERMRFTDVLRHCQQLRPDVVGITAFTNEIKPAAYTAGLIKKHLPQTITVVGGAHITAIPEHTMQEFPTFDIGVFGEGEETLLELCNALERGEDLHQIKGIIFRQGQTIIKNPERPRILDQDSIPMPAWDLLPPAPTYYIQTVRGCPFNCVFCLNHNGKVARKRSLELVIEEMEYLIARGAKRISFGDELFSVDMHRTDQLLDMMIERRIGQRVKWDIQTHVGYVNEPLLAKMKKANIYRCEMGVEAGDEEVLRRMGKAITPKMIYDAFRIARKYDITTGSFLLIGQPHETHRTIWKTIMIGVRINPSEPIIGTMVPYPGTEVAKMAALQQGGYKMITLDWDNYSKQINGALEFQGISKRMLEIYQLLGYTLIFLLNFRFLDFLRFFNTYKAAGIALLKKVLFNKTEPEKNLKPADYDEIINARPIANEQLLVNARHYWKKVQSDELQRTKKLMPHLLKEQLPVETNTDVKAIYSVETT